MSIMSSNRHASESLACQVRVNTTDIPGSAGNIYAYSFNSYPFSSHQHLQQLCNDFLENMNFLDRVVILLLSNRKFRREQSPDPFEDNQLKQDKPKLKYLEIKSFFRVNTTRVLANIIMGLSFIRTFGNALLTSYQFKLNVVAYFSPST